MAVGMSKHLTFDMLMGHDIPGFQKHLREDMDAESLKEGDPPHLLLQQISLVL